MHMQLGSPTAAPAAASATGSAAQQSAPTSAPGASQSLAPASSSAFPWAEGAIGPAQPTRLVPTNTPAAILAPMGPYQVRLGSAHDCMLSTPSCCIAGDCHQGRSPGDRILMIVDS